MHGIKLGLHNIRDLLARAGNPQDSYPTVHVAGTNGKGSVVAITKAILSAAGYRVGCFTSPHLIDIRERFHVNGELMPQAMLDENITYFRKLCETLPHPPTFFELNTAIAFRYFQQANVDIALIETGMGGRLDSTNVITPLVTCITNIDLEHTEYLGDTLGAIAYEKAGILKPGIPAIIGEHKPEALDVILKRADQIGAPIFIRRMLDYKMPSLGAQATGVFSFSVSGPVWRQELTCAGAAYPKVGPTPLALAGRHQGLNAALAINIALRLRKHFRQINESAIRAGLASAKWPGRLERVLDDPPVLIDVAHNRAGATVLAENLDQCVIVLAVACDKDASGMIQELAPHALPLILTQFEGERALPLHRLVAAAIPHPREAVPRLADAIALGLSHATAETPLLITGSIFAAGAARKILIEQYGAKPLSF